MRAYSATAVLIAVTVLATAQPAVADSVYTKLDFDACETIAVYEEGGGADLRCPGLDGYDVFISEGDARTDVDYGVNNERFQTFSAFNGVGTTVEWMRNDDGIAQAAALRFLIDVDGRSAEALVVSAVGTKDKPGCVVGIVDAAADQANGVARGLGAMAQFFDCDRDTVVIVPGARPLVSDFSGAQQ